MSESNGYPIAIEARQLERLAVLRDILDCDPVAAMRRIDRMLEELGGRPLNHPEGTMTLLAVSEDLCVDR
jgi:hypothetical protein